MLVAKLHLVGFLHFFQQFDSFLRSQFKAGNFYAALDNRLHFLLDGFKVFGREGLLHVKVIVEAAVDGRTDGQLCRRIKALDSLRQNMRGRVPESLFTVNVVKCDNFHLTVLIQNGAKIAHISVYLGGTCGLVKTRADGFCDFGDGNTGFKLLDVALKRYLNHK